MATNFLHGYELEGVKESVANFISNISPQETPFSSMTRKVAEHNTTFSWLTDVDEVPTLDTAGIAQGADAAIKNQAEPKKLTSFTQIFSRAAKVDGTAEAMGLYGRGKPMAYQMMKAGRAIKKQIELTLLAKQNGQAASSSAAGKLDGYLTRRKDAAGINAPVVKNLVEASGNNTTDMSANFLEVDLQTMLLRIWEKGGRPSVLMFPPEFAHVMSALREKDPGAVDMFDGEKSVTINRKVDVYVDPLGQRLKLIPNQWMPKGMIYAFEPSMFEQRILRNFTTKDLPASGDYVAKQIIVELGLANKNPDACGILNCSGAALPAVSSIAEEGAAVARKAK